MAAWSGAVAAGRGRFAAAVAVLVKVRIVLGFVWTHPSNRRARGRAMGRFMRFQVRSRVLRRRTLATLGDRSLIWAHSDRHAAAKVVYGNPPDCPEMHVWRQVLKPGDLFVDVGANVGSYTIWTAELGAEVISLEPADDTFALLMENIRLNEYQVLAIKAAAGSAPGTARFTSGRDGLNCFDARGDTETTVVTIDSVIADRTAAGMKVDVEGFEIEVLRGCERALAEHRIKLVQLEWNPSSTQAVGSDRRPVTELLTRHGYQLCRPDSGGLLKPVTDPGFGADVFARPAE